MKFKVYKLCFTAPLHLGDARADYDKTLMTYHSDSMYAAIVSALAKVGHALPENGDLGFTISSLFPYYQGACDDKLHKPVYFLPRINKQDIFIPELRKKIKEIHWLDIPSFNRYISGENIFSSIDEENLNGEFYTSQPNFNEKFIEKKLNPRVAVSRTGDEDARPFYMERLFFSEGSGMYFIAIGENLDILDSALKILKHEGIGTDRTIGNGLFEYDTDEIELQLQNSNYTTNLSLYIPETREQTEKMMSGEFVAYSFLKRGGWITDSGLNTYRKNNIYAFEEGSVFSTEKTGEVKVYGKLVDLKPTLDFNHLKKEYGIDEHPIWRNGKAIFIPVKF